MRQFPDMVKTLGLAERKWRLFNSVKFSTTTSPIAGQVQHDSGILPNKMVVSALENVPKMDTTVVREEIDQCYSRLDLHFENTKEAFKSKSNWELWRQYIVLRLLGVDFLVQHHAKAMNVARRLLGKRLFELVMKNTFYGHFVGGEDEEALIPVVTKLQRFGVMLILDYSVEADVDCPQEQPCIGVDSCREGVISARTYSYSGEPECDHNMEIFCQCIDTVAHSTDATGLAAIKLTALG